METKRQGELKAETIQQHKSLKSRAVQFVSGLSTALLNPMSDRPHSVPPQDDDQDECGESQTDESPKDTVDGPDTSSFAAFLYSLLASPDMKAPKEDIGLSDDELMKSLEAVVTKKRSDILSRGRRALGKVWHQAAKVGGFHHQHSKSSSGPSLGRDGVCETNEQEGIAMQTLKELESGPVENLPAISEPSVLLSEKTRGFLYSALPVIVQGRKWMLLYSTFRHGISLSTLYRRSMLWPGLSLLVVGDCKGAVFGGLVEAPLNPTNKKSYQGTNTSFVFSNTSGQPQIFRPTGINRYFTLCSVDYLALGGGSHFALYLDSDLLSGSSSSSETYGNPCLAKSRDFQVKEVELWGFVYASKYDEMVALSRVEAPGICRW